MQPIDLYRSTIPTEVLNWIPASVAIENRAIPVDRRRDILVVAVEDLNDTDTMDTLRFILNCKVEPVLATPAAIDYAILRYYS